MYLIINLSKIVFTSKKKKKDINNLISIKIINNK